MTQEEGALLLKVARTAIERRLSQKRPPPLNQTDPHLLEKRGAFVTLMKEGKLRGCIGRIEGTHPLIETISQMAIEAAFNDPRFTPLKKEEFPLLLLEVSVLSPLQKVTDPQAIQVGRDGLLVQKGFFSGLLLPQVAQEYHWTREEFLANTCYKAGLPAETWKEKDATLYTFTAEIFSEEASCV